MTCARCHRSVLIAWTLGDGSRVCRGCIRRAINEAAEVVQIVDVLERMRRLGLG